jgi:hypothetical protein
MIVLNLSIGSQGNSAYPTDMAGHCGGALTGLIWGLAFLPRVKN